MASSTLLSAAVLVSHDPATGEVLGEVPVTPVSEIDARVARARAAAPAWAALGTAGRARLLAPLAGRLEADAERLARLATREMGKPLAEARAEVASLWSRIPEELEEIEAALAPEVLEAGGVHSTVHHDPLGVCAAITPWNFPVSMPHWMAFPALAAGNTVLLKPSEETPLCAQAYADLLLDLLPTDVLQVVHGADEQGKALVVADVDLIAFTGSRETGKAILSAASARLTRTILELGGKDPLIVLEDADLEQAVDFATWNSFRNTGQVCVSTERIYVVDAVAERFEQRFAERVKGLVFGNGLSEGTSVGPMVNERQRLHVVAQVDEAIVAGARVLAGGGEHPERFVRPTLLADVRDEMAIARDETFGPVACVTRVANEDEAVERANDTRFGLGAVVFGEPAHAERVARRLTAGMVGVNRTVHGAPGTPWVGARESGFGFHKSRDGHRQFTQTRVVTRPSA